MSNTSILPAGERRTVNAQPSVSATPRFVTLWKRVTTLREECEQLRERMQTVLTQFQCEIQPLETRYTDAVAHMAGCLIDHYRQTSLALADQSLLGLWIHELLLSLEQHPFASPASTDDLVDKWQLCLAATVNPVNSQLERMAIERLGTRPVGVSATPTSHTSHPHSPHQRRLSDDDEKQQGDNGNSGSSAEDSRSSTGIEKDVHDALKNLLSIDRLFRKLAHVLHPDRESDNARKAEKDQLMSACLKARSERDLPTLMALYQTWVGDLSDAIAVDELPIITATLERQARQWQRQLQRVRSQDPLRQMIFERYHTVDHHVTQQRFKHHVESLQQAIVQVHSDTDQLKTAEGLESMLVARRGVALDRAAIDEMTGANPG